MIKINNDDFYLLQDILKRNYFNFFEKGEKNIEFILNHTCNQNCSNCFGCSYDTELYKNQNIFIPTKTNKYDNLSNLIKWYIKNNFHCNIFFRGCIEEESFDDLLKILQNIYNEFLSNNIFPKNIIFETKGKNIQLLNSIIEIFNNTIPIIFVFNIDGLYCDPSIDNYNDIINFIINYNNAYINAKINSRNINNWIKNYKWWILNLGFNDLNKLYLSEILDSSWDYLAIQKYIKFLDFQVDVLSEYVEDFSKYIFNNKLNYITVQILNQEFLTNKKYYQSCLFHSGLAIDLTTLKIPACTKLNYPIFHIGEFVEQEDELIINPINISILIAKAHLKKSCTPHCEYCDFLNLCEKTCYGENYKVSYNPICPVKESCNMTTAKYNFLLFKYNSMGLLNLDNYDLDETFKANLKTLIETRREIREL